MWLILAILIAVSCHLRLKKQRGTVLVRVLRRIFRKDVAVDSNRIYVLCMTALQFEFRSLRGNLLDISILVQLILSNEVVTVTALCNLLSNWWLQVRAATSLAFRLTPTAFHPSMGHKWLRTVQVFSRRRLVRARDDLFALHRRVGFLEHGLLNVLAASTPIGLILI